MDFYSQLSSYYDEIFATTPDDMAFIASQLPATGRLLDIGCGTGNKTVLFSRPDNHVIGIDLDPDMITAARERHAKESVFYDVADMQDIDTQFAHASLDGILCLGNSLVHLESLESIERFLLKCHTLLHPKGILVLQILNYDRILDNNITELPEIDTKHTRFKRQYAWRDGSFRFMTSLHLKERGETLYSDIPLYPLRQNELEKELMNAGFKRLQWYGDFTGGPHRDSSFVTISISRK